MTIKTGYLDKSGHPYLKIKVFGIIGEQFAQEFEAMIDTGFTGFLMLPLMSALPLGLTLTGTANYTLADGTTSPKLLAVGTVAVEDEKLTGVIVLESNANGPLLGMDFLRQSQSVFLLSKSGVLLIHEKDVLAMVNAAKQPGDSEPPIVEEPLTPPTPAPRVETQSG